MPRLVYLPSRLPTTLVKTVVCGLLAFCALLVLLGPRMTTTVENLQDYYVIRHENDATIDNNMIGSSLFFDEPVLYAVYSASTPNGENYRSYDYAFALPLTALAWQRVGFKSVVLVAGKRCEWDNEPPLAHILKLLDDLKAIVIFLESPLRYRTILGQTGRLFVSNLAEFPGRPHDYVITTDADLWPLLREHYVPRPGHDLVLVHGLCCGFRTWNNRTFRMYPMSNVGASVAVWRQVMNENRTLVGKDPESILAYLEETFGHRVREDIHVGETEWYFDQYMLSMRLEDWMGRHGNQTVYYVSDAGLSRVDRIKWDVDAMDQGNFSRKYDSHVPLRGYIPSQWRLYQMLIKLMYGPTGWQTAWADEYFNTFRNKTRNYISFT